MADGITVDVFGNIAVLNNLERVVGELQVRAQEKLEQAGEMALEGANAITPVRTGYMRSRNQLTVRPGRVSVGNDDPKAIFVVFGHRTRSGSFVPPNDFLVPPWRVAGTWLKDELRGLL